MLGSERVRDDLRRIEKMQEIMNEKLDVILQRLPQPNPAVAFKVTIQSSKGV